MRVVIGYTPNNNNNNNNDDSVIIYWSVSFTAHWTITTLEQNNTNYTNEHTYTK